MDCLLEKVGLGSYEVRKHCRRLFHGLVSRSPTASNVDATTVANTMAEFVISNELDGIDVDYEDFDATNAQDGKAEEWLITFTNALRETLPQGQYIITHARKFYIFLHYTLFDLS